MSTTFNIDAWMLYQHIFQSDISHCNCLKNKLVSVKSHCDSHTYENKTEYLQTNIQSTSSL